jgi:hypothetical protein
MRKVILAMERGRNDKVLPGATVDSFLKENSPSPSLYESRPIHGIGAMERGPGGEAKL